MASEPDGSKPGDLSASITPAPGIPQVAIYAITVPADGQVRQVSVEFGTTTQYGRSTSPVPAPPGGVPVTILVAGMIAGTTYHMRARIQFPGGKWMTTADQRFPAGALPNIALPTLASSSNGTPSPGVELVNVIDPTGISVVSDLDGDILWYYDNTADQSWKGYAFPIKPLPNLSPSSRALRPPGHPERSEGSVSLSTAAIRSGQAPRGIWCPDFSSLRSSE